MSWYDTKQAEGKVPGMWSIPSLLSLPGLLWPRVVAPDRVLSMGQIKLNCILMLNWFTWCRTVFDIVTVLTQNWIFKNRTVSTFNCVCGQKP